MKSYDHVKIEKKWQKEWEEQGLYRADDKSKKQKYYFLVEFPYPSGDGLHTGHIRSYTALDILARKRRAEGLNVLYPIGWDAFGLPTENYAIKMGVQPKVVTKKNTDNFRRQLKSIGFSFDWEREINTTDPKYYKWTQWIFLQLFKKGLAYKTKMPINWCLACKIGLANEEVVDGKCERCNGPTEKREKEQWMLAITKYADRLDKDLDNVDYLENIKIAQRNWIGRSEGALISFKLLAEGLERGNEQIHSDSLKTKNYIPQTIDVFTTRADTLFGATFLAMSAELAKKWITDGWKASAEVKNYIKETIIENNKRSFDEKEKNGVFVGIFAINPANKEKIPVWVVNYVLGDVGTGAIMAVPAHDERDYAFAKKYNLPLTQVIEPVLVQTTGSATFRVREPVQDSRGIIAIIKHWSDEKYMGLFWPDAQWGTFLTGGIDDGDTAEETVIKEIREETGYRSAQILRKISVIHSKYYHAPKGINRFGHAPAFYVELKNGERDNVAPEEISKHKIRWLTKNELREFLTATSHLQALKMLDLPVYTENGLLVNSMKFDGMESEEAKDSITKFVHGEKATTYKLRDWVFSRQRYWGEPIPVVHCSLCGIVPISEKDLPVILPAIKSYKPTDTGESPLAKITKWVNTKCPKCKGPARRETDTMPNWAGSSWYYLRYTDTKNSKMLADKKKLKYWTPVDWYNGGMEHTTLHLLYSRFWHKFLYDIGVVPTKEPYKKRTAHGFILAEGGVKMSKSKGNVVNPDDIVKTYGADTLRLYEMFMGPFDQSVAWSTDSIIGPRRFIEKVWRIKENLQIATDIKKSNKELEAVIHLTIKKVTEDIESMSFNTAISQLMILGNALEKTKSVLKKDYEVFLRIVAPFAPHVTEELWHILGHKKSIHLEPWPVWDNNKLAKESVTIVVQVDGKIRGSFASGVDISEADAKGNALKEKSVQKWMAGRRIRKIIYIKNKVVSIVLD